MSRMSESVPFSLHGSQRSLAFHLYLDFQCRLTAATTDMRHWDTGPMKIIKNKLFNCMRFCCHSSLLNGQVKFYILALLGEKTIMDP